MKFAGHTIALLLAIASLVGCAPLTAGPDTLYQTAPIHALMQGVYDGPTTCGELKRHGNLGTGTFNALDGEMVILDGRVWQIPASGHVRPVADSALTPFASVTRFVPEQEIRLSGPIGLEELEKRLDALLPTLNIGYALRMEGEFEYVKTRSVPRQSRPYPRLVEVVKTQPTFELRQVQGTIVGFRLPEYLAGVNVPGYHLHFLTADRSAGGHLLQCRAKKLRIQIDGKDELRMLMPQGGDFYKSQLGKVSQAELEKVEKDKK